MRSETLEEYALKYGKNIKPVRKIINFLLIKKLLRYAMSKKDISDVETGKASKRETVKKYVKMNEKHFKSLTNKIKDFSEKSGIDIEEFKEDIIFCYYAYGFLPDEYFFLEINKRTPDEKRKYVSNRDRLLISYMVNDVYDISYARDKSICYEKFGEYFKRETVIIRSDSDFDKFKKFISKYPVFVQKNVRKNCGMGVKLVDFNEVSETPEEYFKKLREDDEYILEEVIKQSDLMMSVNKSSVNTIRCLTFINNGKLNIDYCTLRAGRNNSFIDNAAGGGLCAQIDNKTGRVISHGFTEYKEQFVTHPDSGVRFEGMQLPDWDGALSLLKELSGKLPDVRWIGWDLAHTDDGWVLVEANGRPQLFQQFWCGPLKSDICEYLGIEI